MPVALVSGAEGISSMVWRGDSNDGVGSLGGGGGGGGDV
jgi:hypothetical protein